MQIKIGQTYKVKPEFRDRCGEFDYFKDSVYIRYLKEYSFQILDKDKDIVSVCEYCFSPEHLEPLEKTLYNLEVNDVIKYPYVGKQKVLGLIESNPENPIYVISYQDNFEHVCDTKSAKQLESLGYKVAQPELIEEIKEMTVEEVSKLVGKKVKIVE
jgi:hypothetical protein